MTSQILPQPQWSAAAGAAAWGRLSPHADAGSKQGLMGEKRDIKKEGMAEHIIYFLLSS